MLFQPYLYLPYFVDLKNDAQLHKKINMRLRTSYKQQKINRQRT
ncbi:hypothetical protein DVU_2182 [Nitratidesulfovibrio vulgaris str. Hildenborough]|uniref:Uncharacterized protein n=1 Tax=Nitratidesulfovibrio vulgaris (strain ATCC 29579 / DSM 644 / CCUG 34227 / NCIMB 8303 / VKM B-1760 / Hildenborough) TaxID=882 RepID=Q72A15_NITV2|nr:hypothetical protein DVU_2182 [Nitratidesulfovibrio vulgaris str. Hildenborough]